VNAARTSNHTALHPRLWNLSADDGGLAWDGVPLAEIAETFGTPAYVASASRFDSNATRWASITAADGVPCGTHFSYKTCPVPGLVSRLLTSGIGMETVAAHEIRAVSAAGFAGRDIIFGGTGRGMECFKTALHAGLRLIILDTLEEVAALSEAATETGLDAEIGLRLALGVRPRGTSRLNVTSLNTHHFGMELNGVEYSAALRMIEADTRLRLTAVHSHVGTGLRDMRAFRKNFLLLADVFENLSKRGFPMKYINVGGGLAAPTVREFTPLEIARYAYTGRLPAPPEFPEEDIYRSYAAALSSVWKARFDGALEPPLLLMEPGRTLSSDAVLLLLRVSHIRERGARRIAVTDGGAMSTGMSVLGEYHELFRVRDPLRPRTLRYDLVGRVPTPLDIVCKGKSLPELRPGDLVAVMDAGAYMMPTATSFASLKPPVILVENGKAFCIVRRENEDDATLRGEADD